MPSNPLDSAPGPPASLKAYSWFVVINNPCKHFPDLSNYLDSKEEQDSIKICDFLLEQFCTTPKRSGACAYCLSSSGLFHCHLVLCDVNQVLFSTVKNLFSCAHIEYTKGTKKEASDYIFKNGKFAEKGEVILGFSEVGELLDNGGSSRSSPLVQIHELIEVAHKTPSEVLAIDPRFYQYDRIIDKMFYQYRLTTTPPYRDVSVYWHFGATGTGKTRGYSLAVSELGYDRVILLSASSLHPFDSYSAQEIIYIDELRADSPFFTFSFLLNCLDGYPHDVDARYSNKKMLWREVHITSPFLPQEIYKDHDTYDKLAQLLRRISFYVYHRKVDGYFVESVYPNNGATVPFSRLFFNSLPYKYNLDLSDFSDCS